MRGWLPRGAVPKMDALRALTSSTRALVRRRQVARTARAPPLGSCVLARETRRDRAGVWVHGAEGMAQVRAWRVRVCGKPCPMPTHNLTCTWHVALPFC